MTEKELKNSTKRSPVGIEVSAITHAIQALWGLGYNESDVVMQELMRIVNIHSGKPK